MTLSTLPPDPPGRWRALGSLATAEFLAMATWFSASAVVPELQLRWSLTPAGAALMTVAVQVGFVVGAVLSATLSLADVFPARRVVAAGAAGAAAANLGLLVASGAGTATLLRFATGLCLAAVYPPAMKAMSTWFRRGRGLALGIMVGAITLGSALPHLVRAVGGLDWRVVIVTTSAASLLGGVLALVGRDGPFPFPRARFEPRQALRVLADRDVRLASYGYFGHMWELYAMWAWVAVYLAASFEASGASPTAGARAASSVAFAAIGAGALGSVLGGVLGDRCGRPLAASVSLVASGSAAVVAGLVWGGPPALVVAVVVFWGLWVVADSAQFSTLVTELADQRYVGTAVTLQLALGYVLTVPTIWWVPLLVEAVGWRSAFLVLVPGPVVGTVAMRTLARRLGDGRLDAARSGSR
ncbi:MFS transporter [Egicoccus halophilus]|uniref:MFS transporter n=1 Tax=Egicoccus halophilus TaxID=1670830 RepID=UPI00197AFF0C|nr:MFS transporter [Egicoccus halophilus]